MIKSHNNIALKKETLIRIWSWLEEKFPNTEGWAIRSYTESMDIHIRQKFPDAQRAPCTPAKLQRLRHAVVGTSQDYTILSTHNLHYLALYLEQPIEKLLDGEELLQNNGVINFSEMGFLKKIKTLTNETISNDRCIRVESDDIGLVILKMRSFTEEERQMLDEFELSGVDNGVELRRNFRSADDTEAFTPFLQMETKLRFGRYFRRLRREGHLSSGMKNTFLDDRDLCGNYNLFVLYSIQNGHYHPCYSCRAFSSWPDLEKELTGEEPEYLDAISQKQYENTAVLIQRLEQEAAKAFMIDRLAGFPNDRLPNGKILLFSILYHFYRSMGREEVYCLARRSATEGLLKEYMSLGMEIRGISYYNLGAGIPVPHWIMRGNRREAEKKMWKNYRTIKLIVDA